MVQERQELRSHGDVIGDARWKPAPLTVLVGQEEFFKRQVLEHLLGRVLGASRPAGSFTEIVPASAADVHAALIELRTPSFLAPCQVVWLRNPAKHLAETQDALLEALEKGLPCGYLVIDLDRLAARTKLAKAAAAANAAIECRRLWDTPPPWKAGAAPYDTELHQWVLRHAARLGLTLSPPLAGELVACTGNAPGVIDQELRKLLDRLGGSGKPTAEQIRALVPDTRRDSVFALVDHALNGQAREAHAALGRLLKLGHVMEGKLILDGASIAQVALGAFTKRLRVLRRADRLRGEGKLSADAIAAAGIAPRFQAPGVIAQLRRTHGAALDAAFTALLEADRALKGRRGNSDPELVLEKLLLRVASPRATA
ncbi:MAG TPA: DNA polymerase III subunit delta [Planctomycetes bacterium]|nr:DNA polymerase III subunit delta [Planctomycetota bacterium]